MYLLRDVAKWTPTTRRISVDSDTIQPRRPVGRPRTVDRTQPCAAPECPRFAAHGNGLCHACYQRQVKWGHLDAAPAQDRVYVPCVGEGCDRVAIYRVGPYCGRCYQRQRALEAAAYSRELQQQRAPARQEVSAEQRQHWTALWMRYMDIAIEDADGSQYALYAETKNAILATGQLPEGAPEVERERFARAEKDFDT